jgi:hypothetical protein
MKYISDAFKAAGLSSFDTSYYQNMILSGDAVYGNNNLFIVDQDTLILKKDYAPLFYSKDTSICGQIINCGYGIDKPKYSNFDKDLKGKWAIIDYWIPDDILKKTNADDNLKMRAITARDKGAAGVIFVGKSKLDKSSFQAMMKEKAKSDIGIPVIALDYFAFSKMIGVKNLSIFDNGPEYKGKINPFSFTTPLCISSDIEKVDFTTANIVGFLEGTDSLLKNEYIVIGGHHDHLGMGGPGSGSRRPSEDKVHYGADDNASGTMGVIEMAKYFSQNKPKRSLIFVTFTAEEMGLLGSKYFVNNPPIPLKSIYAMVNFDMIGRMKADKKTLNISGTGTGLEFDSILKMHEDTNLFKLHLSRGAGGGSDHASFYRKNIPVIFLITGMHDDYHTPDDTWEKIDTASMENVLRFASNVITDLANRPQKLSFKEASDGEKSSSRGGGSKTLGIVPDVSGSTNKGLLVEGLRKGGPAEASGILKGDIIVSLNGAKIANIYDYMGQLNKLSNLKKGTKIPVEVIRKIEDAEKIVRLKVIVP